MAHIHRHLHLHNTHTHTHARCQSWGSLAESRHSFLRLCFSLFLVTPGWDIDVSKRRCSRLSGCFCFKGPVTILHRHTQHTHTYTHTQRAQPRRWAEDGRHESSGFHDRFAFAYIGWPLPLPLCPGFQAAIHRKLLIKRQQLSAVLTVRSATATSVFDHPRRPQRRLIIFSCTNTNLFPDVVVVGGRPRLTVGPGLLGVGILWHNCFQKTTAFGVSTKLDGALILNFPTMESVFENVRFLSMKRQLCVNARPKPHFFQRNLSSCKRAVSHIQCSLEDSPQRT